MKRLLFAIAILLLLTGLTADAQWRSKTHDVYNALQAPADIKIDGELDDEEGWEGAIESVKGTDGKIFCEVEFAGDDGKIYVFREWGGGTWSGADDHSTCFMIAWNPDTLYLALEVTDDEFEHGGGNPWEGDGAQIAFEPSGERGTNLTLYLYNVALNNSAESIITNHLNERTNGQPGLDVNEDVAVTRDDGANKTYYEIRITPENLGVGSSFSAGDELGLGICVNDGDTAAGQGGQKGWSGWYPHAIVHGKNSEKTGLVVLSDTAVTPVDPAGKLTTTWGNVKSLR